jgi:integrase
MGEAGLFDASRIRERILPAMTFVQQAAWMIAEMRAGRMVNEKTRERIDERTIEFYGTGIAYLSRVIGHRPLASLDNGEARELIACMKSERNQNGTKRFTSKTISEYFKTFTKVIKSAVDDKGNLVHPRTWNNAFIGVPKVDKRKQKRPTLTPQQMPYRIGAALLAGSSLRISELLALRIESHISDDRSTLYVREQRDKWGNVDDTLKTPATMRDIDLHPALAGILREFIGGRTSGFLIQTENGTMVSPGNYFRDGFKTLFTEMGLAGVRFHAFRRFREATLQRSEARQILIDYWMGHENNDMSTRYGKQLLEDVEYRKEWAGKVGLGSDVSRSAQRLNWDTWDTKSSEARCGVIPQTPMN